MPHANVRSLRSVADSTAVAPLFSQVPNRRMMQIWHPKVWPHHPGLAATTLFTSTTASRI